MYKVGGSLEYNAPCYVERKADHQLYESLKKGDFCYVLNCRQIGKSSLLVKTKHHLETEGFKCASVDITSLGSENITPSQWYKGIITQLWRSFNLLTKVNLKQWFQDQENLSPIQLLHLFITTILFTQFKQEKIIIFIDEIDSILSLPFSINDFFAFIRFCYNQRSIDSEYNKITFAIFGVATPSDLIQDKKRTPFNIGKPIELEGFTFQEIEPLTQGINLKNREKLIQEILKWTNGQPFLTQKICKLLVENIQDNLIVSPINEAFYIENLIRTNIIDKWQFHDEPEHLKTIRDRIYRNEVKAGKLLEIYQNILEKGSIKYDNTREEIELILSGLVINKDGKLVIKNKIYQEVFNLAWVEDKLNKLRPYSQALKAWIDSGKQDQSRLLRSQALSEAQNWSYGKNLSNIDFEFLSQSEKIDRQEQEQLLEGQKTKAILKQQKQTAKLQRLLLGTVTTAFIFALGFGIFTLHQYHQAKINEIEALTSSAQGQFASNQGLKALVDVIKAKKELLKLTNTDPKLIEKVNFYLRQAVYGVTEYNRLSGHKILIWGINFSQDGSIIVTGSQDNTVKIWTKEGKLINIIIEPEKQLIASTLSRDGKLIATGNSQGTIKIWQVNGILNRSFKIEREDVSISSLTFSPDGKILAVPNAKGTVKLYNLDGKIVRILKGHTAKVSQVKFSADGELIATSSQDHSIKIWQKNGTLIRTLNGHDSDVITIDFSPNGQLLVAGSDDNTIKLWSVNGELLKNLGQHNSNVYDVAFSPDGQTIASVSWDKKVKIWSIYGYEIASFVGHENGIWRVAWSPDGNTLVSGGYDGTIKLWQVKNPYWYKFKAHNQEIVQLKFSPDSKILASGSWDNTAKLWSLDGQLLTTLIGHKLVPVGVDFSPDGKTIVTAGWDRTIKLWNLKGEMLKNIVGHDDLIYKSVFSPNGKFIATASNDYTVKIWDQNLSLVHTLDHKKYTPDSVIFSPDSKLIATISSQPAILLWQVDGKLLKSFTNHGYKNWSWGLDFSSDGTFIATCSEDHTAKLWFLNNDQIVNLIGHQGIVDELSISPDSEMIATASWDRTIKIWNRKGKLLKTLNGHNGAVRSVAFSPDGKWLASSGDDQSIIIWNLEKVLKLNELDYACELVKDYLQNNLELESQNRYLCNK